MNQEYLPLRPLYQLGLSLLSFLLIAFGQPAWNSWLGPLAAICGFPLFFRVLLAHPSAKKRFWLGTLWFLAIQLVQLSWFVSHPFAYIYGVYFALSLWLALEFGILSIFIKPSAFKRTAPLLALAGLWTLFEWSRIFVLSGFSWDPVGLALSTTLYSLQFASVAGIFGLSFWVIFTNLLLVRAYLSKKVSIYGLSMMVAALPYLYGFVQLTWHESRMQLTDTNSKPHIAAVLVQTAFPAEEAQKPTHRKNPIEEVLDEWRQILAITKKHKGQTIDLMVLPEIVVPFGTYAYAFPIQHVYEAFSEILGPESIKSLPSIKFPFSVFQKTSNGPQLMVNNAFWVQGLANYFNAGVVAGLEDADDLGAGNERHYYSAALFFPPETPVSERQEFNFPMRYEKRILLPMGEYIPFAFCREFAAKYGVFGSFTCGKEAKVMSYNNIKFAPSICYEETFSDVTHETRQKGADLLVNLTSDVWYPNSRLPRQHFDLARLRTVENGFPLIRACNTGITSAIDSLGRVVAMLGDDQPEKVEWVPDSILVEVPSYTYWTLYSQFGDKLIVWISVWALVAGLISSFQKRH